MPSGRGHMTGHALDFSTFLTASRLNAICPGADPDIVEAILTEAATAFPAAGLTTPVAIAHFVGQIAAETGGLGHLGENLFYTTPKRLIDVFGPARFPSLDFAKGFVKSPKKLANYVYAGVNGNTLPDDGYTYRGSGLIQLTGRGNFRRVGKLLSMPLEEHPELCRTADSALSIALGYWRLNKISAAAVDATEASIENVTRLINPALQGLSDRRSYFKKALKVLVPPKPLTVKAAAARAALESLLAGMADEAPSAEAPAIPASLSGAHWVAFFPTSRSIDDLAVPFRGQVAAFVQALRDAGASVSISATFRPGERAHLMHYAWRIAREGLSPSAVPAKAGVPINWVHATLQKSRAAARAMVNGYGIAFKPSLTSRHTAARAIDMTIAWSGTLKIRQKNGATLAINTTPRHGGNSQLIAVGSGYGVIKLVIDPPHWSDNGH